MIRYLADKAGAIIRVVGGFFRRLGGVETLPDARTVFSFVSRVAMLGLAGAALLATLMPSLAGDAVAIRLLGASSELWRVGARGLPSQYSFNEWERREAQPSGGIPGRVVTSPGTSQPTIVDVNTPTSEDVRMAQEIRRQRDAERTGTSYYSQP